jgi:hypothetical protein
MARFPDLHQGTFRSRKRGSVTLLAFTVLAVISIVGYAFHQMSVNSVLQIYRFKINEKALAIGDALVDVSKKIAEDMANGSQFDPWFEELSAGKKSVGDEIFQISSGGIKPSGKFQVGSGYQDLISQIGQTDPDSKESFEGTVHLTLSKENSFVKRSDFINDPMEMRGTANLVVEYSMNIDVFKKEGKSYLKTTPKQISTQFQFKRALVQPMVVRHFSFFGQDMSGSKTEKAEEFLGGKYNSLSADAQGNSDNYFLTIHSSESDADVELVSDNPFKGSLGYVLFGTGGDDEKRIYLNLTAGNGNAAESFHLYRGKKGESDFYRLYTTDYKSILDVEPGDLNMGGSGPAQVGTVRGLTKTPYTEIDPTNGIPFYYLARKDYGYAKEWASHPEFGFTKDSSEKIRSNNFHIFGSGSISDARFTVVFGNLFRRCLSLSGYKQVKAKRAAGAAKGAREFEIQAGPIYYYRDFNHLHAHKLYMDERYKNGAQNVNYREEGVFSPIEVWDSRMNWSFDGSQQGNPTLKGSWIFLSGDGLMGRLLPSIARLQEGPDALKLYFSGTSIHQNESTPSTVYSQAGAIARGDGSNPADKTRWVSPLIQALYEMQTTPFSKGDEARGQGFPYLFKVDSGRMAWSNKAKKMSSYLRELLLMFYHTSMQAYVLLLKDKDITKTVDGLQYHHQKIIQDAAKVWKENIATLIATEVEDAKKKYYLFNPFSGSWSKSSRALKRNPWGQGAVSGSNAGPAYYFTLPDPWQIALDKEVTPLTGQDTTLKNMINDRTPLSEIQRNEYNQAIKRFKSGSEEGPDVLFKKYFARIMTDPAWPLPYNYSTRFAKEKFKRYYFREDPEKSDDRDTFMRKKVVPEFRDAIGYFSPRANPYLQDVENQPLNNKIQKKIVKHYRDKYKDKDLPAYFFAKELSSSSSLENIAIEGLYDGRCMYSFSKREKFDARFQVEKGTHKYKLKTVACFKGNLELTNAEFEGGGVLIVQGSVSLKGTSFNGGGLVILAPVIKDEGNGMRLSQVSLIQTRKTPFKFRAEELQGNLVTKGPVEVRRKGHLKYAPGFLKQNQYVVGFQPYISTWEWGNVK